MILSESVSERRGKCDSADEDKPGNSINGQETDCRKADGGFWGRESEIIPAITDERRGTAAGVHCESIGK